MSDLSAEDRALIGKLLSNPLLIPPSFRGWLQQYASQHAMPQIQELAGYRTRRWRVADPITTFQTLNTAIQGNGLVDLATVGPQLTLLEDGTYAFLFGAFSQDGTGISRACALNYNGGAAFSPFSGIVSSFGQMLGFDTQELKNNGNNSVKLQYQCGTSSATANFGIRWLAGVRVA